MESMTYSLYAADYITVDTESRFTTYFVSRAWKRTNGFLQTGEGRTWSALLTLLSFLEYA